MREELLLIYIDRLSDGSVHKFKGECPSDFMGINEDELVFNSPFFIRAQAYLCDTQLIVRIDKAMINAMVPCAICNAMAEVAIVVEDTIVTKEVAESSSGIFDFGPDLRELIILETPQFAECSGNCGERKDIEKYFTKGDGTDADDQYAPFSEL